MAKKLRRSESNLMSRRTASDPWPTACGRKVYLRLWDSPICLARTAQLDQCWRRANFTRSFFGDHPVRERPPLPVYSPVRLVASLFRLARFFRMFANSGNFRSCSKAPSGRRGNDPVRRRDSPIQQGSTRRVPSIYGGWHNCASWVHN